MARYFGVLVPVCTLALLGCSHLSSPRGSAVLWHDPGNVQSFDFTWGKNGPAFAPKKPFTFAGEDLRGTSPKLFVNDALGRRWRVKGGVEVRAETFCTRLAAAVGYYAEPTFFLPEGRVEKLASLRRQSRFIQRDGTFTYASFERFEPGLTFRDDKSWSWDDNPFRGTPQLNGLKILVMLLSDWDNKDMRDSAKGSNNGVLQQPDSSGPRWLYFVDDWGQSLGAWTTRYTGSLPFDCPLYSAQTPRFIRGVRSGEIQFGYEGQHSRNFQAGIRPSDARWLLQYLGLITDAQLRAGLMASGASTDEAECFVREIRRRIDALRAAAESGSRSGPRVS